jgi:hypothetical protein
VQLTGSKRPRPAFETAQPLPIDGGGIAAALRMGQPAITQQKLSRQRRSAHLSTKPAMQLLASGEAMPRLPVGCSCSGEGTQLPWFLFWRSTHRLRTTWAVRWPRIRALSLRCPCGGGGTDCSSCIT